MSVLLAEHTRRAAHGLHRCGVCGGPIPSRSRYLDQRCADNGTVWTFRAHPACHRFYWDLHGMLGLWEDDMIDPGDFRSYVLEAMTALSTLLLGVTS